MRFLFVAVFMFSPNLVLACQFIDALPECEQAIYSGAGDIKSAYYSLPTDRYSHGILGDAIEAGGLVVIDQTGQQHKFILPQSEVFEDLRPRLVDIDKDGTIEIVTIRASLTEGAAVTIYGLEAGQLVEKATTKFHGQRNRWLNIAGFGNLDDSDEGHVYFVRTPHIGGTLYEYRYQQGSFVETGRLEGFSNHKIGSRELDLSVLLTSEIMAAHEFVVPSNNRRKLQFVRKVDGQLLVVHQVPLPAEILKIENVVRGGARFDISVRLIDGALFHFTRNSNF